ncbi:MAG TPA: DUF1553 domain-containing protein, partial [Planctomycetota bacterium]|nr:DUF1553 domain-containing protein [Planctomycetota bacterium]
LQGLFRTFDFASPDLHAPQRHTTTVPQQALFLMNSPFALEQARALAGRTATGEDPARRIDRLYRLVYGRGPTERETVLGKGFVETGAWEQYAQVLLQSNEFMYVD